MIVANESIGVLTSSHAYIFTYTASANNIVTYNWFSQALSGAPKDIYPFGNSSIGVVTDTNAYAYTRTNLLSSTEITGSWYSTPITGTVLQVRPTIQVFSVFTSTHAYSLVPIFTAAGNTSSEWKSVQMSGTFIDSSK